MNKLSKIKLFSCCWVLLIPLITFSQAPDVKVEIYPNFWDSPNSQSNPV